MNIENYKNDILSTINNITKDTAMHSAKQKNTLRYLVKALAAISRTDEHYIVQQKINNIENWMDILLGPMVFICSIVYISGIPNIIDPSSLLVFSVAIISFIMLLLNKDIVAPKIFWLQQNISKSKTV